MTSMLELRVFVEGDDVYTHFGGPKLEWVAGTILSKTGPLSYIVQLHDGRTTRSFLLLLKFYQPPPLPKMTPEASGGSKSPVPSTTVPEAEPLVSTDSTLDTTPVLRRSSRIRRAPDRLRYE
ncbi:hypothetical protein E2C01_101016 [Portunus trituberculatus]|uniref:Uncharacterized protein n=1 Tax=Portunus trituberculatus TaxID=210409 RepID=A0A5B7K9J2_PORTR|nr:hypothetical protein [Portunus trituberculatus]